ncbi:MAG: type II toxin-antitoxin system RelE/ParE family toxin [Candidatus Humimicrobiaceae bacterium]
MKEKPLKYAFQKTINEIIQNPYIGDLSGVFSCDIFYNKINYELAYTIIKEKDETVVVILAGTRENFYNELKRYMKSFK